MYVTDALKYLVENTAYHYVFDQGIIPCGVRLTSRFFDLLEIKTEPEPEDERTVEEIIDQVWSGIEGKRG